MLGTHAIGIRRTPMGVAALIGLLMLTVQLAPRSSRAENLVNTCVVYFLGFPSEQNTCHTDDSAKKLFHYRITAHVGWKVSVWAHTYICSLGACFDRGTEKLTELEGYDIPGKGSLAVPSQSANGYPVRCPCHAELALFKIYPSKQAIGIVSELKVEY